MNSLIEKMAAHAAQQRPVFWPLLDTAEFPDQFEKQIQDLTIGIFEVANKSLETIFEVPRGVEARKYTDISDLGISADRVGNASLEC